MRLPDMAAVSMCRKVSNMARTPSNSSPWTPALTTNVLPGFAPRAIKTGISISWPAAVNLIARVSFTFGEPIRA